LNIFDDPQHSFVHVTHTADCGQTNASCPKRSQSARIIVGGILKNENTINTLANACTGQNPPDNPAQYRSPDEEFRSLLNRGRLTTTGQAAVYQANLSIPSTSQECPSTSSMQAEYLV